VPVEIKELVIRAVVGPPAAGEAQAPGDAGEPGAAAPLVGGGAAGGHEAIVDAAVKEVLRILRASRER
jgi:hypothetical protein